VRLFAAKVIDVHACMMDGRIDPFFLSCTAAQQVCACVEGAAVHEPAPPGTVKLVSAAGVCYMGCLIWSVSYVARGVTFASFISI
jgi:hypothetical protein